MFISWAGPVCSYFPGYMTLRTYRLMPTSEVMLNLYINLYFYIFATVVV